MLQRQATETFPQALASRAQLSARGEPGALIIRHVEAENAHDMSATLATLHPDCLYEDVPTGRTFCGHSGAETFYREWWSAFDLVVAPSDNGHLYWPDDGSHVAESRFRGRHIGPFLGLAPTSHLIEFRFAVFVTFKDGLLLSERFYYDLTGLLRQIGVTELPAAPSDRFSR
jgi:steroid delta-isomerase-like uncharacterized protein